MSYGYGGQSNPFDQRDGQSGDGYGAPAARAPPAAAFGQGPRPMGGGPASTRGYNNQAPPMGGRGDSGDDYGSNVEMASLAQNASSFGQTGGGSDPNAILNECRDIDRGIDAIEQNLQQLRMLQDRSLNEADQSSESATSRQLDALSSETMTAYRALTERVRQVKSSPAAHESRNAPQVSRIDRRLKAAITQYQQVESSFRKKTQDQMARQYRIVRPDADESEVRAAVEDNNGGQMFQQAMMQSGRQGQARAVLNAVQDRHRELQKIEQQLLELAQLFQDMDTLVVQQDVAIAQIDQKGEEVVADLDKGNMEIEVAVETARKTRRKKWWCLVLCITIVVVIAVVVVVYMAATGKFNSSNNNNNSGTTNNNSATTTTTTTSGTTNGKKRGLLLEGRSVADDLHMNNAHAPRSTVEFAGERPVSGIYAQRKIVIPGKAFDADAVPAAPLSRFAGGGRAHALAPKTKEKKTKARGVDGMPGHQVWTGGISGAAQAGARVKSKRGVAIPGVFHELSSSTGASVGVEKEKRYVVNWADPFADDNGKKTT